MLQISYGSGRTLPSEVNQAAFSRFIFQVFWVTTPSPEGDVSGLPGNIRAPSEWYMFSIEEHYLGFRLRSSGAGP
jgi:hypothetical protein